MSDTTYNHMGDDNRSSSYSFWTWLIAIIVAIYLFWAWQHDRGPNYAASCCAGAPVEAAAAVPFSFTAGSIEDYAASGDASGVSWASQSIALKDWLNGGTDWRVEGDASSVTLTGTVDSQAAKEARGSEAQAFFGEGTTVNNLLTVVEPAPEPMPEPEPAMAPANAAVYFPTSVSALPEDASTTLAEIIDWAKNNPTAKVVISGFHDPRGDKAFNIMLSKNRAQSVADYIVSMGVPAENVEMREPQNVEGDGSLKEARRAEVSIE